MLTLLLPVYLCDVTGKRGDSCHWSPYTLLIIGIVTIVV